LAPGRISRKQSQKVLLPVEMPPVIPIAGISGQSNFVFFARIAPGNIMREIPSLRTGS